MKAQSEINKRNSRSYKCTDKTYNKAMKRAKKEKVPLATLIEDVVVSYSNGSESCLFNGKQLLEK